MNYRLIGKYIGFILLVEGIFLLPAIVVSAAYREPQSARAIAIAAIITLLPGVLLSCIRSHRSISMSEGFVVCALGWIVLSLFGALPFYISGEIPRYIDCWFETVSGFTTTGSSILTEVEGMSHGLLYWRSFTHWIGGMGIIFFTLALLPALGVGEQQLFSAESTGLKLGKLHPRVSTTTHWLWSTYLIVTVACALTAVNYAFATIATGGFGTHGASIAYFNSPLIEYAAVVFMMLSSVNFTLLYLSIFKRRWRNTFRDEEFRLYLFLVALAVTIITLSKWLEAGDLSEHGFRESLFNVVAMMSTTGFTTENFLAWPHLTWIILLTMGVIGSCSGSTAGGIKVVRVLTAVKIIRNEFRRILHPRAVLSLRINQDKLGTDVVQSIFAYTCFFILLITVGASTLIVMGLPLFDALGLSISAFSNVGPSIGYAISFLMIAGRLEIFAFLIPFVPSFWREY